jgi:DGQHR domain-containing protein
VTSVRGSKALENIGGIHGRDDLKSIFAQRSKSVDEKTISGGSAEALELKLAGELKDGWNVLRRGKTTIRLAKDKPADRQLEDDVWTLLYRMGFKELSADRHFAIQCAEKAPPRQIDVFAKDEETVFVVECTHAQSEEGKSVKSLIDKIGAMRDDIVKFVHHAYGKEPKLKVKIAIATRNISVNSADRARAEAAGVPILNEHDIYYFRKLSDLLKGAARFQFLARYLRGEKVEGLQTKVPATKGRIGKTTFYNFLISPHELLRLSYISHKSKSSNDDLETYQRMVKPARLAAIGKFLDEGGTFPTNIVVNFKTESQLNYQPRENFGDTSTGTLTLPALYGSAWVIDGQHRLYGYSHSSRKEENDKSVVPVLAYENLAPRDEIQMFIDINTKQVKVSGNLVKEILSTLDFDDADPKRKLEALAARITLRLDDHPVSPVRDRVLTVSQEKSNFRCLTLTSLVDGIGENRLLGPVQKTAKGDRWYPGPLADASCDPQLTMEKGTAFLSGYFSVFATGVEAHWTLGDAKGGYLCTNLGIRALLVVLGKVLAVVESEAGMPLYSLDADDILERVAPYVAPLVTYFQHASEKEIGAFRGRGSSLYSVSQNALQMMSIIHEAMPSFAPSEVIEYMSTRDIEGTKEAKDMIDEMNRIIFEDVVSRLKDHYGEIKDQWWRLGVPAPVRNECDKNYNASEDELDRWQFLFFINYAEIVLYGDNWSLFEKFYNFYGHGKKSVLVRWITKVNKSRTVTHHAEKGPLSRADVDYVRAVYQLVKTHIEGKQTVSGENYLAEFEKSAAATSGAA